MGDSNKCFQCGKPGHFARNCAVAKKRESSQYGMDKKQDSIRNKVTRCFVCRKLGHFARECPTGGQPKYYDLDRPEEMSRRNDEQMPSTQNYSMDSNPYGDIDGTTIVEAFDSIDERDWDFMKNDNHKDSSSDVKHESVSKLPVFERRGAESKYHKSVFLCNTKFDGFLDTCSEKCLIKYSAAKKANLNVQLDDTDVMDHSPTFRSKIISIGKAITALTIESVEVMNIELFVVNDDVLNVDVVIGRTWLDQPHILFVKMEERVHLVDLNVQPFDKFRNIFSNLDIKPTVKKDGLDNVSSSDEEMGKANKSESLSKKSRNIRSKFEYKDIEETVSRKRSNEIVFKRDRGRELVRERSRSRDRRGRPSSRENRMLKFGDRPRRSKDRFRERSRERSRDRFMNRHTGRH